MVSQSSNIHVLQHAVGEMIFTKNDSTVSMEDK